ncbi:hypothetical protein LCGC14_2533200, partial [marine sediment metagenome]
MKRLIALALMAMLIGAFSMSCSKETIKEIAGPTEYDTTVIVDTVTVDTGGVITVYLPTSVHAYALSQIFLNPQIPGVIRDQYNMTVTSYEGYYSYLWGSRTQIIQSDSVFVLEGMITAWMYLAEDPGQLYYDMIEYSELILTYISGDP